MSDFFDDLGDQLAAAVAAQGGEQHASRREIAAAVLVAALALAIAAVFVVSLHGGGARHRGAAPPGRPPFPGAPHSQRFPEFGRCPVEQARHLEPDPIGCVTVRRADLDGDGRRDLVALFAVIRHGQRARRFTLAVRLSGGLGGGIAVPAGINDTIAAVRDVDSRAGAEILVHERHSSTAEEMGVYTFSRGGPRRAGRFVFGGHEAVERFGFTCHPGPSPTIVQHELDAETPLTRRLWDRTDTTYRWRGASLVRGATRTTRGVRLTRADVGVHC